MASPLEDIVAAKSRKKMYAAFALIGVLLGAIQVGYGAASAGQPTWLGVALAVYSFLGPPLGLTAYSNVKT